MVANQLACKNRDVVWPGYVMDNEDKIMDKEDEHIMVKYLMSNEEFT